MIFVDTSAWFALLYEKAAERPEATAAFAEIAGGRFGTPVTSDYILDETFTLLRQRASLAHVDRLAELLRQSPSVRRLRIGESTFEESLKLLRSRPDQRWSFTDCTSFVLMRETRIPRAFTWDPNFVEAGFEVLPARPD